MKTYLVGTHCIHFPGVITGALLLNGHNVVIVICYACLLQIDYLQFV